MQPRTCGWASSSSVLVQSVLRQMDCQIRRCHPGGRSQQSDDGRRATRVSRGPGKQRGWGVVKQRREQVMLALDRKQDGRRRRQGKAARMGHAKRTMLQMVQRRIGRRLFCGKLRASNCAGDLAGDPPGATGRADFDHLRWTSHPGQGVGNRRRERIEQDRETRDPDLQPLSSEHFSHGKDYSKR